MNKKIITFITTIMLFCCAWGVAQAQPNKNAVDAEKVFSQKQIQAMQNVIHDYLLDNPQLMVKVFHKINAQEQMEQEKQAIEVIHNNYQGLFKDPHSPTLGTTSPKVMLVEFFDYQCPHCKEMATTIKKLAADNPQLQVIFKELPFYPGSKYAAKAALAAKEQGNYFDFHNALFKLSRPLTKDKVLKEAGKIGLHMDKLKADMQQPAIKKEIANNMKLAQAMGLVGTPTFIVQSAKNKQQTYYVPGQVSKQKLQTLINKATKTK
jgi:protein-disulfide isomerase